jgi:hypothetical protein
MQAAVETFRTIQLDGLKQYTREPFNTTRTTCLGKISERASHMGGRVEALLQRAVQATERIIVNNPGYQPPAVAAGPPLIDVGACCAMSTSLVPERETCLVSRGSCNTMVHLCCHGLHDLVLWCSNDLLPVSCNVLRVHVCGAVPGVLQDSRLDDGVECFESAAHGLSFRAGANNADHDRYVCFAATGQLTPGARTALHLVDAQAEPVDTDTDTARQGSSVEASPRAGHSSMSPRLAVATMSNKKGWSKLRRNVQEMTDRCEGSHHEASLRGSPHAHAKSPVSAPGGDIMRDELPENVT